MSLLTTRNAARRRTFNTMDEAHAHSAAYWGDHGGWYIVASQHRDSDSLTRSNFRVLAARLADTTAMTEESSHWAVGWVERLIVAPSDRAALRVALTAHRAMDDYPVLDESDWSELQDSEFWQFAKGELGDRDGWDAAIDNAMAASNSGPGDESAEWDIIEAARAALDAADAMVGRTCTSEVNQMRLFE